MIRDIWRSYCALPVWVRVWITLILVPVNLATIFFLNQSSGSVVCLLAIAGLAPNSIVIFVARGFSKSMAFSHLVFWPPLIAGITWLLISGVETPLYRNFLFVLLVVDLVSLGFDIFDARDWVRSRQNMHSKR
jgi:hypothetical protein